MPGTCQPAGVGRERRKTVRDPTAILNSPTLIGRLGRSARSAGAGRSDAASSRRYPNSSSSETRSRVRTSDPTASDIGRPYSRDGLLARAWSSCADSCQKGHSVQIRPIPVNATSAIKPVTMMRRRPRKAAQTVCRRRRLRPRRRALFAMATPEVQHPRHSFSHVILRAP